MKTSQAKLIYLTAKDEAQAKRIAETLLNQRLAACINIFPAMQSLYRWEGKLECANEIVLIVKTTARCVKDVETWVKKLHSYDVPCFLVLPIESGSAPYLKWLEGEVAPKRKKRGVSDR